MCFLVNVGGPGRFKTPTQQPKATHTGPVPPKVTQLATRGTSEGPGGPTDPDPHGARPPKIHENRKKKSMLDLEQSCRARRETPKTGLKIS